MLWFLPMRPHLFILMSMLNGLSISNTFPTWFASDSVFIQLNFSKINFLLWEMNAFSFDFTGFGFVPNLRLWDWTNLWLIPIIFGRVPGTCKYRWEVPSSQGHLKIGFIKKWKVILLICFGPLLKGSISLFRKLQHFLRVILDYWDYWTKYENHCHLPMHHEYGEKVRKMLMKEVRTIHKTVRAEVEEDITFLPFNFLGPNSLNQHLCSQHPQCFL